MSNQTYTVILGVGLAVLLFSLFSGLNTLTTPVFAGAGAQTAAATIVGNENVCNVSNGWFAETVATQGTGNACTYTNATESQALTNESGGVVFPLLPYIGIAGGLILIIFGKPISSMIGARF